MKKLTDSVLLEELKKRFNENKKALHDLRILTKKLEQLNRRLQESETMKSNFLSNIRNEIVNPLTSIMGLSEQVFLGVVDEASIPSISHMIYNEAFNLDFQLRNIFVAAELEAGEASVNASNVDVVTVIENLIDSYGNQAKEKELKVDLNCECPKGEGDAYYFKTDPEKFQIVLSNLLDNAIEYSLNGKRLRVNVWERDSSLNVSVEDEGIGISNDEAEKIFDRFKQLDSGVKKSHKGHGLGLSVTKALVELMGGKIKFESVAGKGCVFTIVIPESSAGVDIDVFSEDGNEFIFESEEEF